MRTGYFFMANTVVYPSIPYNSHWYPREYMLLSEFIRTQIIRIGLSLLWLLSLLPYRALMQCGKWLGKLLYPALGKRRKIARINLELCFPELDKESINKLLKQHFQALGMAFMELGMSWWWPEKRLRPLLHLKGLENIEKAFAKNHGIILLSAHFTTLEIGGRLLCLEQKVDAISTIEKNNIREMLRRLKKNHIVWYAPDQNFSEKNAVLADFFKHPAPSNPATSRLVKISKASVLPFVQYRRADGSGYDLEILPALDNFPTESDLHDTNQINAIFENFIRKQKSHYFWVHRKFKRLPDEYPDVYKDI